MLRTHYDRLKIARDAPIEVVRAAYRALCLKYHPDRNPGDPEAGRSMVLLNAAYEVLSDPDKRQEYDTWIRSVESASSQRPTPESNRFSGYPIVSSAPTHSGDRAPPNRALARLGSYAVLCGIALFVALTVLAGSALYRAKLVSPPIVAFPAIPSETTTSRQSAALEARQLWLSPSSSPSRTADQSSASPKLTASSSAAGESTPAPKTSAAPSMVDDAAAISRQNISPMGDRQPNPRVKPSVSSVPQHSKASIPTRSVRHDEPQLHPDKAPNGEPWPPTSAYIQGYEVLYANGGSQLIIDNSHNDFDVFLKVVSVTEPEPKTVRSVFVLAHDQFKVTNLRTGTYEVRYHELGFGTLLRSSTFALEESAIAGGGTRYSIVTLPLQVAADESANTYPLTVEEFEQ